MEIQSMVELRCAVMQVRFHREDYSVCLCRTAGAVPDDAVVSKLELSDEQSFIAAGYGLKPEVGKELTLTGRWTYNKKYGTTQFDVHDCVDYVGTGHDAIVEYLASGILKGVRKSMAEKIYAAFGDETLDILENEPQRLLEVSGIREKKLQGIIESFVQHQDMHLLTRLLSPYHVSYRVIVRIHKKLGVGAAAIIKENPYVLCNVTGVGFDTADDIAIKMGTLYSAPERITGAISYTMLNAMRADGHVYITRPALIAACVGPRGVLNSKRDIEKVSPEEVNHTIDSMLAYGKLVQPNYNIAGIEEDILYLPNYLAYETMAGYAIYSLLTAPAPPNYPDDWTPYLDQAQAEEGVTLADMQREAALMALSSQLSIITGGPGSGKTTSLRIITKAFLLALPGASIMLAAPTGRAARRMEEQTGMPAETIHGMLELRPDDHTDFAEPCESYLTGDFIIIDEASMMDSALFAELLYRIMPGTKVLILGDADQLPSVGPGHVLHELLSIPDIVPHVTLDKVFRQDAKSIIPINAAKVRNGETDLIYSKEQFHLQRCRSEESGAEMIVRLMTRLAELGELDSVQILCPMRRRGETCTRNLNDVLHNIVNPPSPDKQEATIARYRFRVGDKVMQTRNIGKASNGDIGYITYAAGEGLATKEDAASQVVLKVKFDSQDEEVEYDYDMALELEPANAITIHKSQGGEFDRVIIPIFRSMSFFLRRNLFYTAITRAREQVVIVSDELSIAAAILKEDTSKRNTALARLTRYCVEDPSHGAELIQQSHMDMDLLSVGIED